MQRLRADLWSAAFVRRHNDLGHICVVARRGDPVAGQIWIEVDHLNGTLSLFSPAPGVLVEDQSDWFFQVRFDRVERAKIDDRLEREAAYDPDFWIISLELRQGDLGIQCVDS